MIFSKTKQFRAMVSIDDLQDVVIGLFKEPIIGSLKSKIRWDPPSWKLTLRRFFLPRVVRFG